MEGDPAERAPGNGGSIATNGEQKLIVSIRRQNPSG